MAEQQLTFTIGANISRFQSAMKSIGSQMKNTAKQINETMNGAEDKVENSTNAMSSALKKVGSVLAGAFALDKMKDFSVSSIQAVASAEAMSAQFSSVFKEMEGQAQSTIDSISKETGILGNRMTGTFTKIASFAKVSGMDTADALNLSERAMMAVADSSAFYDKSLEEVAESLQSFLKGNYENDSALGLSANETTRNAKANELYGQSFKDLSESQKQLTLLAMVEDANKASGALGQASRESDGLENVVGNLKQAFTDFQAQLALPFLEPVIQGLKSMTQSFQNIDVETISTKMFNFGSFLKDTFEPVIMGLVEEFKSMYEFLQDTGVIDVAEALFIDLSNAIKLIGDNLDIIIPLLAGTVSGLVAFKVITTISNAMTAFNAGLILLQTGQIKAAIATWGLNAALLANPFTWIAVGIGALIAVVILLWKNWDSVSKWLSESWEWIKGVASSVFNWLIDFFKKWGLTILAVIMGPIGILALLIYKNWDSIKSFAVDTFNGLMNFLSDTWNSIVETASNAWDSFVTTIENLIDKMIDIFTETDWLQLGKDILTGIVKGITEGIPNLLKSIGKVATDALGKAKEVLKSGSPSRLFADEVGKSIPQGVALGVKQESDVATDAVGNMSKSLSSRSNLRGIVGAIPQAGTGSVVNNITLNAVIREDADVLKLAKELKRIQEIDARAKGSVRYA